MFDRIEGEIGNVTVLLNHATIDATGRSREDVETIVQADAGDVLMSMFLCSREFASRYRGNHGHVVNIAPWRLSSDGENQADEGNSGSSVVLLTRSLSLELRPEMRVNCVTPVFHSEGSRMKQFQLSGLRSLYEVIGDPGRGKAATADQVFQIIVFILEETRYLSGVNFFVDGGFQI